MEGSNAFITQEYNFRVHRPVTQWHFEVMFSTKKFYLCENLSLPQTRPQSKTSPRGSDGRALPPPPAGAAPPAPPGPDRRGSSLWGAQRACPQISGSLLTLCPPMSGATEHVWKGHYRAQHHNSGTPAAPKPKQARGARRHFRVQPLRR